MRVKESSLDGRTEEGEGQGAEDLHFRTQWRNVLRQMEDDGLHCPTPPYALSFRVLKMGYRIAILLSAQKLDGLFGQERVQGR